MTVSVADQAFATRIAEPGKVLPDVARRIDALDGLRGVAAFCVVFHHMGLPPLGFRRAYLAVDFFFLLSGFVIARAYDHKLNSGLTVTKFMIQRVERLYPMLFVGSVLALAVWPIMQGDPYLAPTHQISWMTILLCQFLLIPFLISRTEYPLNLAQWSILFELIANLLYAIFRPVLNGYVLVAVVMASGCALWVISSQYWNLNFGWGHDNFWRGIPRVSFSFFLGVLLFRTEQIWVPRIIELPFWLIALALLTVLALPVGYQGLLRHFDIFMTCVVLPLIFVFGRVGVGLSGVARTLGLISYPLYILQGPMLRLFGWLGFQHGYYQGTWWVAYPTVVLVGGIAWLAAYLIDEPLNRLRRRSRATA